VVSNSTPLIFLAKIGRLNILEHIFKTVNIPNEVYTEVVIRGKEKGYSDAFLVEKLVDKNLILKKDVEIKKLKNMPIGKGEQETIELAMKLGIPDILIDDAKGRRIARVYDLKPKGTLWVLTKAYEEDVINKQDLKNCITELIKHGFRIKEEILIEILKELI
jgi:predicted nucleic acid-binding protein